MPQHRPLTPAAPWVEVVATDEDWDAADPQLLRTFYAQLVWIRAFEQYVLDLAGARQQRARLTQEVEPDVAERHVLLDLRGVRHPLAEALGVDHRVVGEAEEVGGIRLGVGSGAGVLGGTRQR